MLEVLPIEQDGERLVALRDPAGFTDQIVVFALPLLDLVSLFDGEHSVAEIQAVVQERYGQAPTTEQIGELAERLDEAGFLDSQRFEERRRVIEDAFRASPVRPAAHSGGAYAGEAPALAAQIEAFFTDPEGPGAPGALAAGVGSPPLRGLIAPHIDFHRGGSVYG